MSEWLQQHWPTGAAFTAGYALFRWLLGREIKRRDEDKDATQKQLDQHGEIIRELKETCITHADVDDPIKDHEGRLRRLEENRVTKDQMDEMRVSLMTSITMAHTEVTRSLNSLQSDVRILTEHLLKGK